MQKHPPIPPIKEEMFSDHHGDWYYKNPFNFHRVIACVCHCAWEDYAEELGCLQDMIWKSYWEDTKDMEYKFRKQSDDFKFVNKLYDCLQDEVNEAYKNSDEWTEWGRGE